MLPRNDDAEGARKVLTKSLAALPRLKHPVVVSKAAILEYQTPWLRFCVILHVVLPLVNSYVFLFTTHRISFYLLEDLGEKSRALMGPNVRERLCHDWLSTVHSDSGTCKEWISRSRAKHFWRCRVVHRCDFDCMKSLSTCMLYIIRWKFLIFPLFLHDVFWCCEVFWIATRSGRICGPFTLLLGTILTFIIVSLGGKPDFFVSN